MKSIEVYVSLTFLLLLQFNFGLSLSHKNSNTRISTKVSLSPAVRDVLKNSKLYQSRQAITFLKPNPMAILAASPLTRVFSPIIYGGLLSGSLHAVTGIVTFLFPLIEL